MLNLQFRKGFPNQWMGQFKLYVFELILNDGKTCEAVVDRIKMNDTGESKLFWRDSKTKDFIEENTIKGWRETYNCDAARQDIEEYFSDPASIITKDRLGDAFARHIIRESCRQCEGYYEKLSIQSDSSVREAFQKVVEWHRKYGYEMPIENK